MTKPLLDIVADLNLKFTSGNEVQVERATITRKEWVELVQSVWELQRTINMILITSELHPHLLSNQFKKLKEEFSSQAYLCPKCSHIGKIDTFLVDMHVVCPSCEQLCIEV